MIRKSTFAIFALATVPLLCNVSYAVDPFEKQPIKQRSDFDKAMSNASSEARKSPVYTPPNPHEGRVPVGKDYSIGGERTQDGASINIRTTTK